MRQAMSCKHPNGRCHSGRYAADQSTERDKDQHREGRTQKRPYDADHRLFVADGDVAPVVPGDAPRFNNEFHSNQQLRVVYACDGQG